MHLKQRNLTCDISVENFSQAIKQILDDKTTTIQNSIDQFSDDTAFYCIALAIINLKTKPAECISIATINQKVIENPYWKLDSEYSQIKICRVLEMYNSYFTHSEEDPTFISLSEEGFEAFCKIAE